GQATSVPASFGSLTINADGSYRYVVDNSNATVQALSPGQTLVEQFTY
ncbi:VCBS domain-containing protein, partial [Pseudomonas putida]